MNTTTKSMSFESGSSSTPRWMVSGPMTSHSASWVKSSVAKIRILPMPTSAAAVPMEQQGVEELLPPWVRVCLRVRPG